MSIWMVLIISGILTYFIRLSFLLLLDRWQPSEMIQRALRFVPPAVFSAIILPELLIRDDSLYLGMDNLRLYAGLVTILVAWRTRNGVLTILIGMASLLVLQALFPGF